MPGDRFVRREALAPEVWLAHDERLGRDVVLKQAEPGEPRAMARLNHPHVITVYEHVDGWAVLEHAPGGSLAGRQLPVAEAARIGAQIADALVYMHAKGLVHCDVKPGNIVLAENGVAKLTDFGSAYRVDPELTITPVSRLSYTPAYAAPELMRGSPMPASDVYSLAATVRALVADDLPVLTEMLDPNPHRRPNAADARRLFETLAGGDHPTVEAGPAQLPADVYGFAGRTNELDQLDRARSPVVVISGTAGVGKTSLAIHWAHRVASRFPAGQLYVNLRGFDPTGQVMDPADAIRGFLEALGVPPERIPLDLDAQAALYRSTLSTKRVLVVLDNARDTDQVRPLLPGNPHCQVIVTSRNDLIGLVTKEAAHPLTLDVLSDAGARELLDQRLGTDRTAAEPDAVDQIIASCARLPLALAIVAARAAIRPNFPLAGLTVTLAGEDPDTDIRTVFSWSYQQLSPEAQRLFRLLGLHPGPDISAPAAASLYGGSPPLAELTRAHLITEHVPGRYAFHDLLRAYARAFTDDDQHATTRRMLDHYLHTAYAADRIVEPQRDPIAIAPYEAGVNPEPLASHEEAMAWFDAEHSVLLAVPAHAASAGFDTHAWQLMWSLCNFFGMRGHWHDQISVGNTALEAAGRLGDRPAQARIHRNLAFAYIRLGRFDDAQTQLRTALDRDGEAGDRIGQAYTHERLSFVCERQGRYADALGHAEQALDLFRSADHQVGQALALNAIGWDHVQLGDYHRALASCEQALDLFRQLGDVEGEATTRDSIGYAHHHLRQYDKAAACYRQALDLLRGLGARYDEADTLTRLGDTQLAAGDPDAAVQSWQQALSIHEDLDHPDAEAVRAKLERLDRAAPNRP